MNFNNIYRENILHIYEDKSQKTNVDITIEALNIMLEGSEKPFGFEDFMKSKCISVLGTDGKPVLTEPVTFLSEDEKKEFFSKYVSIIKEWIKNKLVNKAASGKYNKTIMEPSVFATQASSYLLYNGNSLLNANDTFIDDITKAYELSLSNDNFSNVVNTLLKDGRTWESDNTGNVDNGIKSFFEKAGNTKIKPNDNNYIKCFKSYQDIKINEWFDSIRNEEDIKDQSGLQASKLYMRYISSGTLNHLTQYEKDTIRQLITDLISKETKSDNTAFNDEGLKALHELYGEERSKVIGDNRIEKSGFTPFKQLNELHTAIEKLMTNDASYSGDTDKSFEHIITTDPKFSSLLNHPILTVDDVGIVTSNNVNQLDLTEIFDKVERAYGISKEKAFYEIYKIELDNANNFSKGINVWTDEEKELVSLMKALNDIVVKDKNFNGLSKQEKNRIAGEAAVYVGKVFQGLAVATTLIGTGIGAFIPGGTLISPLITGIGKWMRRGGKLLANAGSTLDRKIRNDKDKKKIKPSHHRSRKHDEDEDAFSQTDDSTDMSNDDDDDDITFNHNK